MFGQIWNSRNKFLINRRSFSTLTEYVGIREVMVDQSVVDGNSFGDMFLHSSDQLTCHFFQLAFRQEAEKEKKLRISNML